MWDLRSKSQGCFLFVVSQLSGFGEELKAFNPYQFQAKTRRRLDRHFDIFAKKIECCLVTLGKGMTDDLSGCRVRRFLS